MESKQYCVDLLQAKRLKTIEVNVGKIAIGGDNPIVLQSMTTTDTMDVEASVEQSIRMIDSGCELVRLTAPSKKEAEKLLEIRQRLNERGYFTPLVADIHFTPNAAEIAAMHVEKVRVNPGNYADKKKFEEISYTEESYLAELQRIEDKFTPLIKICKEQNTALRIGTNHGSLSDRILSKYGDTPLGMVESAYEFIRICEKNDFYNIIISMKASNTIVMVHAYRLLASKMLENNKCYPLHLGVTEAGDGEDGRIKSAVGIGTLLEDGLGDTIRVSLTEEPEFEIPVAKKLAAIAGQHKNNLNIENKSFQLCYNPFSYEKRATNEILNIGNKHVPVIVADLSNIEKIKPSHLFAFGYRYSKDIDKWHILDQAVDYIYTGDKNIDFELPGTLKTISTIDHGKNTIVITENLEDIKEDKPYFFYLNEMFVEFEKLKNYKNIILVFESKYDNKTQLIRNFRYNLAKNDINLPVIIKIESKQEDLESFQIETSSVLGCSLIDGFGDGIWIKAEQANQIINSTAFGILQATRTRISKTEYISCPSCGRTLFDLQETTNKIRNRTSHLKGIKIGIMGCIVNGPGEMADADYGYVGSGEGVINLYKEKNVIKRNVPSENAVDELIKLIKENGDWIEPKNE